MPPHRLFTFIGALTNIKVLQVMYAIETPVTLKNEVGMTLTQLDSDVRNSRRIDKLDYISWYRLDVKRNDEMAYKLEEPCRRQLGIGARTSNNKPVIKMYLPSIDSMALVVARVTTKPSTPVGMKRIAVSSGETLSTC